MICCHKSHWKAAAWEQKIYLHVDSKIIFPTVICNVQKTVTMHSPTKDWVKTCDAKQMKFAMTLKASEHSS